MDIIIDHMKKNRHLLLHRDYLLDVFTEIDRVPVEQEDGGLYITSERVPMYKGKLCSVDNMIHTVTEFERVDRTRRYRVTTESLGVVEEGQRLLTPQTPVTVNAGDIENHSGNETLESNAGRFLLNQGILCDPFGSTISYVDKEWKVDDIESVIVQLLLEKKVDAEQVTRYINNAYFVGHFTELCVPSLSKKSLTTSPDIEQKKKELIEKYREGIEAGDPVTMSLIEDELIKIDKDYLKGDSSMGFLGKDSKAFNICRKKMYLMLGMSENFGSTGEFSFTPDSLSEGWSREGFPNLCNEIRSGSYFRGIETAKGGVKSKELARALQNARITEDDCGTTKSLRVRITGANMKTYLYRHVATANGTGEILTEENIQKYKDREISIWSPLFCKTRPGYCYKCMGDKFRTLSSESLTLMGMDIGSTFMMVSMKAMHGVKNNTITVNNLNPYTF